MADNKDWCWKTLLPPELEGSEGIIKETVRQVGQLTAWSWGSVLAYKGQPQEGQEKTLKQFFIEAFQTIAQNVAGYESYNVAGTMETAIFWSSYLSLLFLGENQRIVAKMKQDRVTANTTLEGVDLTLHQVLDKLQGTRDQNFPLGTKDFNEQFIFLVTFNKFQGTISPKEATPAVNNAPNPLPDTDPKYVMMFTYPPRPAFSDVTITEEKLENWAKNIVGPNENSYLGPAYVPIQSS